MEEVELVEEEEGIWRGSFEFRVSPGDYILWIAGDGVSAQQPVTVTNNKIFEDPIQPEWIDIYEVATYNLEGIDAIWLNDYYEGADYTLLSSSFSEIVTLEAEVRKDFFGAHPVLPVDDIVTGEYQFLQVTVEENDYYFPVYFLEQAEANNLVDGATLELPNTITWDEIPGADEYHSWISDGVNYIGPDNELNLGEESFSNKDAYIVAYKYDPNELGVIAYSERTYSNISGYSTIPE